MQAPTAVQLVNEATVQQTLEEPRVESLPADTVRQHEEDGWRFIDIATGTISARRAPAGELAAPEEHNE